MSLEIDHQWCHFIDLWISGTSYISYIDGCKRISWRKKINLQQLAAHAQWHMCNIVGTCTEICLLGIIQLHYMLHDIQLFLHWGFMLNFRSSAQCQSTTWEVQPKCAQRLAMTEILCLVNAQTFWPHSYVLEGIQAGLRSMQSIGSMLSMGTTAVNDLLKCISGGVLPEGSCQVIECVTSKCLVKY